MYILTDWSDQSDGLGTAHGILGSSHAQFYQNPPPAPYNLVHVPAATAADHSKTVLYFGPFQLHLLCPRITHFLPAFEVFHNRIIMLYRAQYLINYYLQNIWNVPENDTNDLNRFQIVFYLVNFSLLIYLQNACFLFFFTIHFSLYRFLLILMLCLDPRIGLELIL